MLTMSQGNTVDLILFMGQSNMAGRGITSEQWPEEAPALTQGAGWEFRAISDPTKLYPIAEPFGVDENNPEGIYDVFSSGVMAKTGSMVTAFANAYYEKTGVPMVGVSASKGGSRIAQWLPEAKDGFLKDSLERYHRAVTYLQGVEEQDDNAGISTEGVRGAQKNGSTKLSRCRIRHRYVLWCQGESDGDRGTTAEEYTERFNILWQEMKKAGVEKCFLIQTGKKNVPGEEEAYEEIRQAQEELCDGKEIIMVSRCLGEMQARGLMKDSFHYYQQAYNECGTEAGKNVGDYVNLSSLQIDTERCVMRKLTLDDANDLHEVLSNEEVMQYIEPTFNLEQTREFIQDAGLCEPPRVYALEWKETGKVIGHVIFHLYEEDSYEVGWILNRNYWGKGIADEITKALVEYVKGTKAKSCVIECDAEQEASKRLALKNGFIFEGEDDVCEVYRLRL